LTSLTSFWVADNWDAMYEELVKFKQEHSPAEVPGKNTSLADWCQRQRANMRQNKLPPERRDRMEEIGFDVELRSEKNERVWNANLERLKEYNRTHGNCFGPPKRASNNLEDAALVLWVANQRSIYKRGTTPDHRIQKLEEIGFVWSIVERKFQVPTEKQELAWEKSYEKLREFYEVHGHFTVPQLLENGKINPFKSWIGIQRKNFAEGQIIEDRRLKLEAIGFIWDTLEHHSQRKRNANDDSKSTAKRRRITSTSEEEDEEFWSSGDDDGRKPTTKRRRAVSRSEEEEEDFWSAKDDDDSRATSASEEEDDGFWSAKDDDDRKPMAKRRRTTSASKEEDEEFLSSEANDGRESKAKRCGTTSTSKEEDEDFYSSTEDDDRKPTAKRRRATSASEVSEENEEEVRINSTRSLLAKYSAGTKVKKFFKGHGWFLGEIASINDDEEYCCYVRYEDGDEENYFLHELEDLDKIVANVARTHPRK
jgi:hypothetical protein